MYCCKTQHGGYVAMPQEVSISYQAVKSKVYKLIDALVEGVKTETEVQESMERWWKLIHPADRPVAQKYLLLVLARSSSSLGAIADGLVTFKEFRPAPQPVSEKLPKLHDSASPTQVTNIQV
jgi:hypothetical protein